MDALVEERAMTPITIQNLDDTVVQRLRQKAWQDGVPLEEAIKRLLCEAVTNPPDVRTPYAHSQSAGKRQNCTCDGDDRLWR